MPKYVVGAVMVVITIFSSIAITIVAGTTYMNEIPQTEVAKANEKLWGHTGWSFSDPLMKGANAPTLAGKGKTIFIREGCVWCHTLLPEQTQDWTYFGAPPKAGDVQGESPSLFWVAMRGIVQRLITEESATSPVSSDRRSTTSSSPLARSSA